MDLQVLAIHKGTKELQTILQCVYMHNIGMPKLFLFFSATEITHELLDLNPSDPKYLINSPPSVRLLEKIILQLETV